MTIFDKIADTYQQIQSLYNKLFFLEVQATTPKSGEITGMPKEGGSTTNPIERYIIRKEEIQAKIHAKENTLKELWKCALDLMKQAGVDGQTIKMMYMRFCRGMLWKECAAKMNKLFPNCTWNENKCFRKYREVLTKVYNLNAQK